MSWRRALSSWIAALVLAAIYFGSQPSPSPVPMADQAAAPQPTAAQQRAYELDPATLVRVEVRRGDAGVTLDHADGGWKVAAASGQRTIPAGLVQAFVDQLVDSGHGERVADSPDDPAFGLAASTLRIEATEASGRRLTLVVGARTPTGAAAYALLEPQRVVVLVGLNLLYYADLLLG